MTDAGALLERYLRQRRELGEIELVLERPVEIAELIRSATSSGPIAAPSPAPAREAWEARDRFEPGATAVAANPPLASPGQGAATSPEPRGKVATPVRPPADDGVTIAVPPAVGTPLPSHHPLTVLNVAASGCTACDLASTRTHVVFGEGSHQARLMVVGEAPGADEDRTGRPFVGRAGMLLNTLLQSIGLPRESVYICNVLKCRPPGNRNPLPGEVEACAHFLQGQLEAIAPRAILAVGTFPAQALLRTTEPIGRLRGRVHSFDGTPLVPTYHPAALLRNPGWIRPVWEDLQRLREVIDAA